MEKGDRVAVDEEIIPNRNLISHLVTKIIFSHKLFQITCFQAKAIQQVVANRDYLLLWRRGTALGVPRSERSRALGVPSLPPPYDERRFCSSFLEKFLRILKELFSKSSLSVIPIQIFINERPEL